SGDDGPRPVALPLLADLLLAGDGLLGTLAGAGVGVGALTPDRQAATVAQALVAADLHLALDVLVDLTTEVALDLVALFDHRSELGHLGVGQVPDAGGRVDPGGVADLLGRGATDAVDVGEGDDEALLPRDVDAGDACHGFLSCFLGGELLSPGAACGAGCRR